MDNINNDGVRIIRIVPIPRPSNDEQTKSEECCPSENTIENLNLNDDQRCVGGKSQVNYSNGQAKSKKPSNLPEKMPNIGIVIDPEKADPELRKRLAGYLEDLNKNPKLVKNSNEIYEKAYDNASQDDPDRCEKAHKCQDAFLEEFGENKN